MAGDSSITSYFLSATDCRKIVLLGFGAWQQNVAALN